MKNGDPVIYANTYRAKVIFQRKDGLIRIKFDDHNLIPDRMNVPIEELQFLNEKGQVVEITTKCPKCEVEWVRSQGLLQFYYDCPSCGAKKEDYS